MDERWFVFGWIGLLGILLIALGVLQVFFIPANQGVFPSFSPINLPVQLIYTFDFILNDGTVLDQSDNSYNGTVVNAILDDGAIGRDIVFKGNGYVQSGDVDVLQNFTISSWIRMDKTSEEAGQTTQNIISKGILGGQWGPYDLRLNNDSRIEFAMYYANLGNNNYTVTGPVLNKGQWYFVAAQYNGTDVELTLDNVTAGSVHATQNTWNSNNAVFIGAINGTNGAANFFNGAIDEVRIYNKSINSTEMALAKNGLPGPLVDYEMTGIVGGYIDDVSPNNFAGKISGTSLVEGHAGNAMYFSGNSDIASHSVNLGDSFTIRTWVRVENWTNETGQPYQIILSKALVGSTWGPYALRLNNESKPEFVMYTKDNVSANVSIVSNTILQKDRWYYLTVTVNDKTPTLQVNVGAAPLTLVRGSPYKNDNPLSVGAVKNVDGSYDNKFYGVIDYLKIDNKVINSTSLQSEYTSFANRIVRAYPFNRINANNYTRDWSVNALVDGNVTNGALTGGVLQSALLLKGDGYVNGGDVDIGQNFTISTWVKLDKTTAETGQNAQIIATKGNIGVQYGPYVLRVANASNALEFLIYTNDTNATSNYSLIGPTLNKGQWYFVAAKSNGTTLQLVVDDQVVAKMDNPGVPWDANNNMFVGATNSNAGFQNFFNGAIDDFRVYNVALSDGVLKGYYDGTNSSDDVNSFCGDGIVNNGEVCDDGNGVDNDACSNSCTANGGGNGGGGGGGGHHGGGSGSCTQQWSCVWSTCTGGLQYYICNDLNSCGNETGRPAQNTQSCTIAGSDNTGSEGTTTLTEGTTSVGSNWAQTTANVLSYVIIMVFFIGIVILSFLIIRRYRMMKEGVDVPQSFSASAAYRSNFTR